MPERTTLTGKTTMTRMTGDDEGDWDDCDDCDEWVERLRLLWFFLKIGQQKFKFEKQEHLLQISEFAFNVEIM